MCCCRVLLSFLAASYEGAFLLLITGLMGLPALWIFNWAFNVGAVGFLWVRYLNCSLLKIRLLCFIACVICFWYLLVGLFGIAWNLLSVRNVCTNTMNTKTLHIAVKIN